MRWLLFLFCAPAFAQPCLPAANPLNSDNPLEWIQPPSNIEWIGGPITSGVSVDGAWIRWHCAKDGVLRRITYVGTTDEMSKVGSRMQTILKAADPLKSLQDAPKRFTILPLTDPSLAKVVEKLPQ